MRWQLLGTVSFWGDECVLKLPGGDGGTTLWPYSKSLHFIQKGKFYSMCIFNKSFTKYIMARTIPETFKMRTLNLIKSVLNTFNRNLSPKWETSVVWSLARKGSKTCLWLNEKSFFLLCGGVFFCLFSFFSFLASPCHLELPGQESDLSHSCDLCCSCGNTRSLTYRARPGIKPASQCCRDTDNLFVPQQELLENLL